MKSENNSKTRILFGGDFVLPRGTEVVKINLDSEIKEVINRSDFFSVNLESPIIKNGIPISKIGSHFKNSTRTLEILKNIGVEILCTANNHIGDFGFEGIKSTLDEARRHSFHVTGSGNNREEIESELIVDIDEKKIAIINVAEEEFGSRFQYNEYGYHVYDIKRCVKKIVNLKRQNIYKVIIVFHGGLEYHHMPLPDYQEEFRFLIELGADAVICHHTHYYSGFEFYKNGVIAYGLGNFFSTTSSITKKNKFKNGILAELIFDQNKVKLNYYGIKSELSGSIIKIGFCRETTKEIENISKKIVDKESLNAYWQEYFEKSDKEIIHKYYGVFNKLGLFSRILKRIKPIKLITNKVRFLLILNVFRNNAHRRFLNQYLNYKFKY